MDNFLNFLMQYKFQLTLQKMKHLQITVADYKCQVSNPIQYSLYFKMFGFLLRKTLTC